MLSWNPSVNVNTVIMNAIHMNVVSEMLNVVDCNCLIYRTEELNKSFIMQKRWEPEPAAV